MKFATVIIVVVALVLLMAPNAPARPVRGPSFLTCPNQACDGVNGPEGCVYGPGQCCTDGSFGATGICGCTLGPFCFPE